MTKKIKVTKDGPYAVTGGVPLKNEEIVADSEGSSVAYKVTKKFDEQENYNLCRCGHSKNKPYCDGSHVTSGFEGTETASKATYEDLVDEVTDGDGIELLGVSSLCASARFCHQHGGTWDMVEGAQTDEEKKQAIHQCCQCCSGRLTVRDKATGKLIEEELPQEIAATEDAPAGKQGPLYVSGGIEVEDSEGEAYPTRNRMTLCRCGKSRNKPFCDSSHLE